MSIHIHYGPLVVDLQQDAEGFSFACPLCHNLFFSTGNTENCRKLVQDHLQQFHRIVLPQATISQDDTEPTKVQIQRPA